MFSLRRLSASHARSIGSYKRLQSSAAAAAVAGRKIVVEGDQKASASGIYEAPFARARLGSFFQAEPQLGNQFTEDVTLQKYLKRHLPPKVYQEIYPDLERFGHRVATDLYELHRDCEKNPPKLETFDSWGKRVDRIVTCPAWKKLKAVSAEEGLIAIAYERKQQQWSRVYQMAKLYLFTSSSGLYSCPLAMTDGAAKSIEVIGRQEPLEGAYQRLTSRDPSKFWTSGQWMTERRGGSDVAGGTETLAVKQDDGTYKLYGYKWFSSATDSDMSLTLARPVDKDGQYKEGTGGLSMFYLEVRDSNGDLNNIEVQRLKDKLGTRQLPTAELLLDGVTAVKVSPDGRGVASIANMLTLTRLHNSISAASAMRRILNLARDYSLKRSCFGIQIKDHHLHIKNLANMEIEARGALLLSLEISRLLGLDDCQKISPLEKDVFRLLTPVAKLYTAKQAMSVTSEGLECFGGMGYLEDTGLPQILRDAQVLPIWEGTTNVLSLDVLRAVSKTQGGALLSLQTDINQRLQPLLQNDPIQKSAEKVQQGLQQLLDFAKKNPKHLELASRDFAFSIGRLYIGLLLLEQANWTEATAEDSLAANRWCQRDMIPIVQEANNNNYARDVSDGEFRLVYDGYPAPVIQKSRL